MSKFQVRMAKLVARQAGQEPLMDELDQLWMRRIRQFLGEHFHEASQGGGDWAAHAQSTIEARRRKLARVIQAVRESGEKYAKQKAGGIKGAHIRWSRQRQAEGGSEFLILDETHVIRDAVETLDSGASIIQEPEPLLGKGLVLAGGGSHGDGDLTTAELASFHQKGNSRLPAREIITELGEDLIDRLIQDLREVVMKIAEETNQN